MKRQSDHKATLSANGDPRSKREKRDAEQLPASKVFDLKVIRPESEDKPFSTHSFCTSCSR